MLLSSLEHFRRLLHALGAMVCGVARWPPIGPCRLHTRCAKNKPLGTVVFQPVQPNERPDKPWQRAAHSRLRLSFRNMVHAWRVLRWRTGSNAPRCRERYKSLDFEKYVCPPPPLRPEGKVAKKLFCYLACFQADIRFTVCVSCPDIYIGNTFGRTLMPCFHELLISQYCSRYTRYMF